MEPDDGEKWIAPGDGVLHERDDPVHDGARVIAAEVVGDIDGRAFRGSRPVGGVRGRRPVVGAVKIRICEVQRFREPVHRAAHRVKRGDFCLRGKAVVIAVLPRRRVGSSGADIPAVGVFPLGREGAEVPLAEVTRRVADPVEHLREWRLVGFEASAVCIHNTEPMRVAAGEATAPGGRADSAGGVEAIKAQALGGHRVERRGVDPATVIGRIAPAEVVGHHQDDVRALVGETVRREDRKR